MNAFSPLRETPVLPPFPCESTRRAPACVRRVLVLDDERMTRRLTARFLAHAGYSVDAAEDGELGWEALCASPYDLLVTDNDMPRLTGMELVERLRAAGLTLPVIIASGSLDLGEAEDYAWLAPGTVLHKPFSFSELVAAARRAAPVAPDAGEGWVHYRELQPGVPTRPSTGAAH